MAKRFCDTEIWDKDWFMNLSCKHKCLIRFIFDKCDVAGIWEPNWILATTYVGEKCTVADLESFKHQIQKLPGGKILICDFISFQYGTLSEKSNPHVKVISILKKHDLYEGYLRGTLKGTSRVKEEDKDKEEDKEEEMKEEETPEFEVLQWPTFDDFWNLYDKKIDKQDSIKAWDRLKQDEKEKALQYIPAYKATREKRFMKDPVRYLNKKVWESEIITNAYEPAPTSGRREDDIKLVMGQ